MGKKTLLTFCPLHLLHDTHSRPHMHQDTHPVRIYGQWFPSQSWQADIPEEDTPNSMLCSCWLKNAVSHHFTEAGWHELIFLRAAPQLWKMTLFHRVFNAVHHQHLFPPFLLSVNKCFVPKWIIVLRLNSLIAQIVKSLSENDDDVYLCSATFMNMQARLHRRCLHSCKNTNSHSCFQVVKSGQCLNFSYPPDILRMWTTNPAPAPRLTWGSDTSDTPFDDSLTLSVTAAHLHANRLTEPM